MKTIVKEDFNSVGINVIDTDLVLKKWNHLWWISQWKDEYRLIKNVRIDSGLTNTKLTISSVQAEYLIKKLDLQRTQSFFRSGASWRREEDSIKISEYHRQRDLKRES